MLAQLAALIGGRWRRSSKRHPLGLPARCNASLGCLPTLTDCARLPANLFPLSARYRERSGEQIGSKQKQLTNAKMNTEYRTPGFGISNIYSTDGGVTWGWSNRAGEGCGEVSFEAAVASAESALTWKADATDKLRELAALVPMDMAAHVAVREYSSDDATPTLHIDLWRGFDLVDLPQAVAELAVAVEGHWDGGRTYSLHIA